MPPPTLPPGASLRIVDLLPEAVRARGLRTERPAAFGESRDRFAPYVGAHLFDQACNLWAIARFGRGFSTRETNDVLARELGVSVSLVRALRRGEKPVTLSRLCFCPADLVRHVTCLVAAATVREL